MIIVSGSSSLTARRQIIPWYNVNLLHIGPSGTNFSEIWIKIKIVSCNTMRFNVVCKLRSLHRLRKTIIRCGVTQSCDQSEIGKRMSGLHSWQIFSVVLKQNEPSCNFRINNNFPLVLFHWYYNFRWIFMNENACILYIKSSLKFFPKGTISESNDIFRNLYWWYFSFWLKWYMLNDRPSNMCLTTTHEFTGLSQQKNNIQ